MKNQGISLISLIITIIVIIILAAIVIFTGLGTPDSANFAKFCSSVDDVQMAVLGEYSDLRVAHAISGDTRTDEDIYNEIATGDYTGEMGNDMENGCANLKGKNDSYKIGNLTLPLVNEDNEDWYVTADGKVFNKDGYKYDGKVYFNASLYSSATADAATIAAHIASGDTSF